jgi:hypothetical protein
MPVLKLTAPMFHFLRSSADGIEYAPAVYAESMVTAEERMSMEVFLVGDHENGEMNGTRFGEAGKGGSSWTVAESLCLKGRDLVGSGVSKSR